MSWKPLRTWLTLCSMAGLLSLATLGCESAAGGGDTTSPSDQPGPGPDNGGTDNGTCQPQCDGKECGDDGCGNICGRCELPKTCDSENGQCVDCTAQCTGKECGSDGCGGSCGTCEDGFECTAAGACECIPQCLGKFCGDDGCGGSCGSCTSPDTCSAEGQCVPPGCTDTGCGTRVCGDAPNQDTCPGVQCGACTDGQFCGADGQCSSTCTPSCDGKECGDDGCAPIGATECGACTVAGETCIAGQCVACTPNCAGKQCGDDGCGGSCGSCTAPQVCNEAVGLCQGEAPEGACPEYYECAQACSDPGCVGECANALSPEGLQRQQALQQCLQLQCGQCGQDNDCINECMTTNCLDAYLQCFHRYGVMDCAGLFECLGGCPNDDRECIGGCQDDTSADGMADYFGLFDCLGQYCDSETLTEEEWQTCVNDVLFDECSEQNAACTVSGTLTCEELFNCLEACPEADQACGSACIDQASYEAKMAYQGIYACFDQFCAELEGDAWLACANAAINDPAQCGPAWDACYPPGNLSCEEMFGCMDACPEGDQDCAQNCYNEGSREAQGQYQAIYECIDEFCAELEGDAWVQCANASLADEAQCKAQWDTCFPPAPPGDLTCAQMFQCISTCEDQACARACFQDGTAEAQAQYEAIYECFDQFCGTIEDEDAWLECANASIADEAQCKGVWEACQGSMPEGTLTCEEMFGCISACEDQACAQECYADGTSEARAQYEAIYDCFDEYCGTIEDEDAWLECANASIADPQQCQTAWETCMPVETGEDTCADVYTCMNACSDQSCAQACMAGGTADAQQQMAALAQCIVGECGEAPTEECAATALGPGGPCNDEYTTCMGDAPASLTGQRLPLGAFGSAASFAAASAFDVGLTSCQSVMPASLDATRNVSALRFGAPRL